MMLIATPARQTTSEIDDLLLRYLRALEDHGQDVAEDLPAGRDVRTCAHCGANTFFRLDPQGGWAFCEACSRAA